MNGRTLLARMADMPVYGKMLRIFLEIDMNSISKQ